MIKIIKVKEETHKRLKKIPVKMGDTFDSVIDMLLDNYENNKK